MTLVVVVAVVVAGGVVVAGLVLVWWLAFWTVVLPVFPILGQIRLNTSRCMYDGNVFHDGVVCLYFVSCSVDVWSCLVADRWCDHVFQILREVLYV